MGRSPGSTWASVCTSNSFQTRSQFSYYLVKRTNVRHNALWRKVSGPPNRYVTDPLRRLPSSLLCMRRSTMLRSSRCGRCRLMRWPDGRWSCSGSPLASTPSWRVVLLRLIVAQCTQGGVCAPCRTTSGGRRWLIPGLSLVNGPWVAGLISTPSWLPPSRPVSSRNAMSRRCGQRRTREPDLPSLAPRDCSSSWQRPCCGTSSTKRCGIGCWLLTLMAKNPPNRFGPGGVSLASGSMVRSKATSGSILSPDRPCCQPWIRKNNACSEPTPQPASPAAQHNEEPTPSSGSHHEEPRGTTAPSPRRCCIWWPATGIARLVLDAESRIVDLGRTTRGFPTYLKNAGLAAARGRCSTDGCTAPFRLAPSRSRDALASCRHHLIRQPRHSL